MYLFQSTKILLKKYFGKYAILMRNALVEDLFNVVQ